MLSKPVLRMVVLKSLISIWETLLQAFFKDSDIEIPTVILANSFKLLSVDTNPNEATSNKVSTVEYNSNDHISEMNKKSEPIFSYSLINSNSTLYSALGPYTKFPIVTDVIRVTNHFVPAVNAEVKSIDGMDSYNSNN